MDGNDLLLVRKAAETAVLRARKGEGPSLIENKTYRIRGHFEGDPQKYRRPAEVALWEDNNDPIARFSYFLTQKKILTEGYFSSVSESGLVSTPIKRQNKFNVSWLKGEKYLL